VEVQLVTARYVDFTGRPAMFRFVIKRLHGRAVREAGIYEQLTVHAGDAAPALLAVDCRSSFGSADLYLQAVRRTRAWPWRDLSATVELLAWLARFHGAAKAADAVMPPWDYEADLLAAAEQTAITLDRCGSQDDLTALVRDRPFVNRLVQALPRWRPELLSAQPFGSGPIHGDVHTANAFLCRSRGAERPVLVDWARARVGSPLEDVSSWLQSLICLEPEVQRRHDTLLAAYLSARGTESRLTDCVRAAYWLAAASNGLAGALRHHLDIAADAGRTRRSRVAAYRAARGWLRIMRRADAWWG
jgi:hypothetical protein